VTLELPPGKYTIEIERGPEYESHADSLSLETGGAKKINAVLKRLADLPAEGWWPGDLHVHRPVGDIELLMRAEDLHIAPVITWWNNRNQWEKQKPPADPFVRFDGNRYYHVMAGGGEGQGGGAALLHP